MTASRLSAIRMPDKAEAYTMTDRNSTHAMQIIQVQAFQNIRGF